MKIESIDRNFKQSSIGDVEVIYRDAREEPFAVEGFPWCTEGAEFFRLPPDFTIEQVNDGALWLARHTAGGAIRFRSDSPFIAIRTKLRDSSDMNHMTRTGSAGFDIYAKYDGQYLFRGAAQPNPGQIDFEVFVAPNMPGTVPEMRDWLLNMPLYGGFSELEIGLAPGSLLEAPPPHAIDKPVAFYGSSITQGGCASRPGMAYPSLLCRALDAEQINLGFSGSGRGEPAVAEAIAGLDLSCFVLDYDHNAPNPEHLEKTHEPFFKIIRQAQPELPILMLSRCDTWPNLGGGRYEEEKMRREIIRRTYQNAVDAGDKNVYFIDGEELFGGEDRNECTVDNCHPNDLGFYRMHQAILPVLRSILR